MLLPLILLLNYEETIAVLTENITKKQDWQVKLLNDNQKSTEAFTVIKRVGSMTICNPPVH